MPKRKVSSRCTEANFSHRQGICLGRGESLEMVRNGTSPNVTLNEQNEQKH